MNAWIVLTKPAPAGQMRGYSPSGPKAAPGPANVPFQPSAPPPSAATTAQQPFAKND